MTRSVSPVAWVASVLVTLAVTPALAFDLSLCSSGNTGAGGLSTSSTWMSAGKCHDNCNGYAFAVVQGLNCWCSDYAPGVTLSLSDCATPCPGFPYENCASDGYYGYVVLDKEPIGTQGGSSQTDESSSESLSQPSPDTVTVRQTETATQPASISYVSIDPPTISSRSSRTTPSSTWSPTPYASIKTVSGDVQTVTVTPTAPPPQVAQNNADLPQAQEQGGFWNETGKVAGTFTVVGVVIAALIGAAVFFFLKRRNRTRGSMTINSIDEDAPTSSNGAPYMVDRRRSNLTLATAGLAGLTRGSSNEKSPHEKTPGSVSRRGSLPMVHDQRLNPAALWNAHPNGSHASVASFRDDQDYSRPVLHVRNPDEPSRE